VTQYAVAIVGFGAWGTALSALLGRAGHRVSAYTPETDVVRAVAAERVNRKYLPECPLPPSLVVTGDPAQALAGARFVLWAVPTQALGAAVDAAGTHVPSDALLISLAKGFERGTHRRPSQVLQERLPRHRLSAVLGPSHAEEVALGRPTVVAACAQDEAAAAEAQALLHGETFRVYRNDDLTGAECGAALKNVIAIAAGMADGLGFGDNAKGALMTRGLAEMSRLGVALGGRRETFFGLTGLGDLIATCISRHSRNRRVGEGLGRGRALAEILGEMTQVAEGVPTSEAALEMAEAATIAVPITEQVVAVLRGEKSADLAWRDLMARDPRAE
jgi:glycerol-3-phosphate dehydrogenase (NAD(P)+)